MNERQRGCHRLIRKHVSPGGEVLEISCGEGRLLRRLKADGYPVRGTNYSEYDTVPDGVPVTTGVSVISGLPFPDAAFDCVVLCDVIEHLSDHARTLAEAARVLRDGGFLVVLSPNINRLSSRLHYFFTGFLKVKRAFIGFDVPPGKAFTFHNHPVYLPVYLYQAHSIGMDIADFAGAGFKLKSALLWLLFAPAVKASTWFTARFGERNLRGRESGRLVFDVLTSYPALCAESWISVHRKSGGARSAETRATRLPKWHRTSDR